MTRDGIGNYLMVQRWPAFPIYVFRRTCVLSNIYIMVKAMCSLFFHSTVIMHMTHSVSRIINTLCMKLKKIYNKDLHPLLYVSVELVSVA